MISSASETNSGITGSYEQSEMITFSYFLALNKFYKFCLTKGKVYAKIEE
jgi:hypothetical protein